MAQEPETEKNASGIAHAAKRKWGYDAEQVDAFLERAHMLYEGEGAQLTQHDIQNVSFELVKGGYVIARPADKISFQEIIDALDITILGDADTGGAEDTSLLKATVQECLWDQMTAYLRQFCSSITLQDMMDRYRNSIPQDEAFMYYI